MTEAENMEVARQIAAQAWCDPETSGIEMDVRLAEAFAKRIAALRARCEAAEAEVANQRRLRMLAEEAIPKGVEVARDYFAAEAEANLRRANAETDLVRQGLDMERTARLAAEAEAEKWRSEARRALAAERARDEARAEVEAWRSRFLALVGEDRADMVGNAIIRLRRERDEACAEVAEWRQAAETEASIRRDLCAENTRLVQQIGHAGWVGGMVLGICEGAPGWELVKEYPAGPEVEAWGAPSIVAAKALRRERDEAREALRGCLDELEAAIRMLAREGVIPSAGLGKKKRDEYRRVLSGEKEGA